MALSKRVVQRVELCRARRYEVRGDTRRGELVTQRGVKQDWGYADNGSQERRFKLDVKEVRYSVQSCG